MSTASVYRDIACRTGGSVYIGVVGPVRTGKSTFIKRFMETLVIPHITDVYARERARDELPQSGSGRTIMTAEPKFVPEEAAVIALDDAASCAVRLVDCVGFMVSDAVGVTEGGAERMVMTPWHDEEIPISEAAEEGTRRVIADHSSLAVMVTTDGSICGIKRASYVEAEERTAAELSVSEKPYILLLNCAEPKSESAIVLAGELSAKYGVSCLPVNCAAMTEEDMTAVLGAVLYEFPLESVSIYLPEWLDALDNDCAVKSEVFASVLKSSRELYRLSDVEKMPCSVRECRYVSGAKLTGVNFGTGEAALTIDLPRSLYYDTISAESGFEIQNDGDLVQLLRSLAGLKTEYERVHDALEDVKKCGYGIVMPTPEEMRLAEPEIVRQGGRYGVRLKAGAPAIHMIQTDIETEVSPALGGEKASEEIVSFLLQGYEGDTSRIWESNIFGKSLYDIAEEGLTGKITRLPEATRNKLRETLQRIINEGSGGLICIIF
ncbi:MAG: stage IV sporulation protein A [Oscillospiraceae bacterium]|nr:stage IV sporulation protein A [Oscillospiraceae bacterium]